MRAGFPAGCTKMSETRFLHIILPGLRYPAATNSSRQQATAAGPALSKVPIPILGLGAASMTWAAANCAAREASGPARQLSRRKPPPARANCRGHETAAKRPPHFVKPGAT